MRVTLVMICKNEEAIIRRALESVKPRIHSWLIADNGSTDRTCEIVEETMGDLPGRLVRTDWKGFAANRNEAFREAEKLGGDYLLMLDCDDLIEFESDFKWPEPPLCDGYRLRVTHGDQSQGRAHLFKCNVGWIHESRVHEYSVLPGGGVIGDLGKCTYVSGSGGARAQDPKRWDRDAELLEQELKEKPDDPRSMFYLGRSYLYAGKHDLALKAFERRMKLGGWYEERWYASYERLRVGIAMKLPKEILVNYALESYAMLPSRAEPLWEIAVWLRKADRIKEAFPFAVAAAAIPRPKHDGIFLSESVYHWQALDEAAVAAYWVGLHDEAKSMNEQLLELAPADALPRIRANLAACTSSLSSA
jgi:glycosyltransferase involved in cell wall biosynthesis